eukprot:TRINITY_DN18761_c0_g1_i1.p1 TRINITY_DN18761_c0_g1~~TRINITY_DN18761_c0_g1_i1.p1  ORF type:complete len:174 (-),score=31.48 TRINITY_DN18761_c0_g1_i1:64-564(-)
MKKKNEKEQIAGLNDFERLVQITLMNDVDLSTPRAAPFLWLKPAEERQRSRTVGNIADHRPETRADPLRLKRERSFRRTLAFMKAAEQANSSEFLDILKKPTPAPSVDTSIFTKLEDTGPPLRSYSHAFSSKSRKRTKLPRAVNRSSPKIPVLDLETESKENPFGL